MKNKLQTKSKLDRVAQPFVSVTPRYHLHLHVHRSCGPGRRSLEKVLEHGGRVGGSGLLAFDGVPKVLDSAAALPDLLELAGENLRSAFSREPGLLQTELAHLHVVLT